MGECVYIYTSCCDVLEVWCGFMCLEYVIIAWFEFKSYVLILQPNLRSFWSIRINEFSPGIFMKVVASELAFHSFLNYSNLSLVE